MAISDNYVPLRQLGNGVTTQFSGTWAMLKSSYARVYLENATTGFQTLQTLGVDYTISITSTGFTVTFTNPPSSANYAVIGRETDRSQTTPYTTSGGFQGGVEEDSFDKLTAMVQEINSTLSRNISAPLGDTANLQVPNATLRANSYLGFDASGNVKVFSGGSSTLVSAAMTPIVQASTLALARSAMGVAGSGANSDITALNALTSGKINNHPIITQINIQKFTSSGTYTPTAGMVFCIIECWGGGGGGGGVTGQTGYSMGGGGGGAGSYSRKLASAAQIGVSQTVTIGSAGAGASGANGGTGGQTSVGTLCISNGGSGGTVSGLLLVYGGSGGAAGTGDIISNGSNGQNTGSAGIATNVPGAGGLGASTSVGQGGLGGIVNSGGGNVAGYSAGGYGAGGGGAASDNNNAISSAGGNGSPGIVIVTEFISA